ncbi:MAG TPA: AAA family ATPase, partial [Longimicrobium sp.]|nr:AAA family ATPase [Longimicrobium sp.]
MTTPLLSRLTLQNFLSFGPEGVTVDLLPLNVLIGPNGSGKSNLLEALSTLRATPGDLQAAIREGGGIAEYLWKGPRNEIASHIQAIVRHPQGNDQPNLHYFLGLAREENRLVIQMESIGSVHDTLPDASHPLFLAHYGSATIFIMNHEGVIEEVPIVDLKSNQSILSQRRDPLRFPELTFLGDEFGKISLFREWTFGGRSSARLPQPTDLPIDFLLPDASNLGMILHDISQTSAMRDALIFYLRRFYEPARSIATKIYGG